MSVVYARLITSFKYKYPAVISAKFLKQNEDGQMLNEIELYITSNFTHNFSEIDLDNINVKFELEEQIHRRKRKNSGWRFG